MGFFFNTELISSNFYYTFVEFCYSKKPGATEENVKTKLQS